MCKSMCGVNCASCGRTADANEVLDIIKGVEVPKCKHCNGIMKPKVVLHGENLYEGVLEAAVEASKMLMC